jgi:catechol 2,3-dioxygenase
MSIMRLGYVHVRVTDLDAARSHYSDTLGLKVMAEEPGKLFLKGWDEYDHHSVVVEEGGVGLVKFGYKCRRAEDLEQYEKALQQFGVSVERMSKGENLAVGDGIRFTAPSEHVFEIYSDIEYVGTETGALNPEAWPRDVRGVGAPRIDHALITADDVDVMEKLFQEVFDWHISERVVTDPADPQLLATWMFCGQTAHDLAVLKGPNGKLHHFAFWLEDWNAVLRAGDLFAMDDVSVDVGPTRHGITRGTTIYFFDPAGNRNEVFSGGYQTNPDFPTITWTADQLGKGVFYIQRELNERFTSVLT